MTTNTFTETQLKIWEDNLLSREKNLDKQDDYGYIAEQIDWLRSQETETQKSDAWIMKRLTMITASDVYKCLGTPALLCSLVRDKCVSKPVQIKAAALDHGVTFEPVARRFYEFLRKAEVAEFGCLRHRSYEFLGASPDGVVVDSQSPFFGRLLEIKVPKSRELCSTSLDIPRAYMVQMQIQMEVANLPRCDYLECRIEQLLSKDAYLETKLEEHEYKGVFCVATNQVLFCEGRQDAQNGDAQKRVDDDGDGDGHGHGHGHEVKDRDCVTAADESHDSLQLRNQKECGNLETFLQGCESSSIIFFHLKEYFLCTVEREPAWFRSWLPKIQCTWQKIIDARLDGNLIVQPKKRASPPQRSSPPPPLQHIDSI